VAPDVPPIVVTPDRIVALVPEDDPSVVWPVCEPVIWHSSDGATWEPPTGTSPFPEASYVYDVAWRDGRFVAVGGIGFDNAKVWTSVDARTWVEIDALDPAADVDVTEVDAGPLGWVIAGTPHDRSTTVAWYSTDGACWETVPDGVAAPGVAVGDQHVLFVDDEPARVWVGTPTNSLWPFRSCL
jgi:hypothetical protein